MFTLLIKIYFGVSNLPLLQYDRNSNDFLENQKRLIQDYQIVLCSHDIHEDAVSSKLFNDGDIIEAVPKVGHAVVMLASTVVSSSNENENEKEK